MDQILPHQQSIQGPAQANIVGEYGEEGAVKLVLELQYENGAESTKDSSLLNTRLDILRLAISYSRK